MALSSLLPAGLELDTWQGQAFVGIVPFAARHTRAPFLPPVPLLSDFYELNLRTYVHRQGRNPGVLFFSLDATSRLAVWGARALYKLPYFHASIAMESSGAVTSFSSLRVASGGRPRFACRYAPASPAAVAAPHTREFFLIERYLLYSWDGRRLRRARVWHHPYRVATAHIESLHEDVTASAGIVMDRDDAPIAHCADDVDVRIYPPSLVAERVRTRLPGRAVPASASAAPAATLALLHPGD